MRQLISKKEAAKRLGYHPTHLMRLSRAGAFPRPFKIGNGPNAAVRFDEGEVEGWLSAKMAERDAAAYG